MTSRTLTVELPDELILLLGSPGAAASTAREALVVELLRDGRVSQGQAARLLAIPRWDLIALMGQYQVPSGPESIEDLDRELELVRRDNADPYRDDNGKQ